MSTKGTHNVNYCTSVGDDHYGNHKSENNCEDLELLQKREEEGNQNTKHGY